MCTVQRICNFYKLAVVLFAAGLILTSTLSGAGGTLSVVSDLTNETVFSAEEAGVDSNSAYGLMGRIVISNPLDVCSVVDPPPPINFTGAGPYSYILMGTVQSRLSEDRCPLARKAKIAQAAGYAGLVLRRVGSNDTTGVSPQFIGLDWMGIRIYACVVGDDIGGFLMDRYAYPNKFYVRFDNEPYLPLSLLTNFVIIGLLAIIIIILLLRLFHYLYNRVTTRVVERRRIRKTLLSEAQLRKLPVLKWTPSIPQDTCSICIDEFDNDAEIRVLPCSHVFHKSCIDVWLLKESRKCPNCKGRILFPNERRKYNYSSDSDDQDPPESADERTPLLRPRENYRFVETLTESHNTRALHEHYLQEDMEEEEEDPSNQGGTSRKIPRVKFAPAVSIMSSASSSASSTTTTIGRPAISKAFVLPGGRGCGLSPAKVGKSSLKVGTGTLRRISGTAGPSGLPIPSGDTASGKSKFTTAATVHSTPHGGGGVEGGEESSSSSSHLSACSWSSSSTDDTLISNYYDIKDDHHDPTDPTTPNSGSSLSSQSFHSCQELLFDPEDSPRSVEVRGERGSGPHNNQNQSGGNGTYGSFHSFTSA